MARSRPSLCHITLQKAVIHTVSITLATSPRHSEHKPSSNRSPALTAPEKLVIVTSWRHFPHQTFDSSNFFVSLGILAHNLAAGAVNLGMDSMGISVRVHTFSQFLASLEVRHILGWHFYLVTIFWITPQTWWSVIQSKAAKATYFNTATFR